MKRKTRTKALSWLLCLTMLMSLVAGMSLTAYAEPTEELLTTITATGTEQASYSVANVATVSFSYTSGGSSAYLANWGWWGYGFIATVTPADGYTITKCVFYDDANRTATDSEAPFVVETTEEDKTPKVNGTPILAYTSKGIKKIEVYGYQTPSSSYAAYLPAETDDATALAAKVVKFNGHDWYLIEDNSTSETEGTVTLFAKDPIGKSKFHDSSDKYSESAVKEYLDNLTNAEGTFAGVADAIKTVETLTTKGYNSDDVYDTVSNVKLYLLSTSEAYKLPVNIRKCGLSGYWWLRSPGKRMDNDDFDIHSASAALVDGYDYNNGEVYEEEGIVAWELGVRPALRLDLSQVTFASVSLSGGANASTSGDSSIKNTFFKKSTIPEMATITYTANEGYMFPVESNSYGTSDGITVTRTSDTCVTVSGTPTGVVNVTIPDAVPTPHTHDDITFTAWTSTNSLPTEAGNYYLTGDVKLDNTWFAPNGTTNLCLDGHSITAAEGKEIQLMDVENGATLNLYDKEDNSGSISGAVSVNGAILVNSGTFNMYGGTIKDNMTTDHGAGVRVQFGGTFSLYGGSIENNKTQSTTGGCGGGVHVEQNSTFNMYGGSIKNNTAAGGAGVFIGSNCTFNLSGGSITGNIATNGEGGVSFTSDSNSPATFKLSGNPTVTDNIFKFDDDMADFHISDPSNVILGEEMKIEVVGALTGDGKISISKRLPGVFTNSSNSVKASDYIDKFATDSRMYRIKTEGDDLRIEAPHLVVGGTFVYDDNAADVFGDGKVKFTPASDENSNAKLTLNGYQYDGREVSEREGIVYFDNIPLDIVLKGENIIKVDNAPGIMINAQANTVISSDNGGSLEVESAQGDAIYANGALTVESGTISATGGNRGIAANGINLNGGKIVAKATGEQGYGIYCDNLPWLPANSVSINSGISSLIASGTLGAVYGGVANALEGLGWSNITGTDGQKTIAVTAEARSLEYKKVAFVSHTHSFTYSASGATITATCANADGGCTLTDNKVTLTIAAPDNLTYDKSAKAAVVTDANAIQGTAKVQYQTKSGDAYGEATETAPTNAGTYKASITVGGATASVEYTIAKADPTYTAPTGLTATYGQTLADVTLTNPSGNTAGTWAWADSRTSVGNFGTNTFKASFVPTDTTNYNTKTNIDVSVTVGKANITPTVSIEGWTYGQEANAPSVSGNTGNGAVTYTYATKGSDNFSATVPTNAGNYTVKATIAATANYNGGTATADFTIAKVNITPTVSIDGWTYNQTAKTPSVSGNTGNGEVTYTYATKGSDNFSATVPANAGNYTVKATIAANANYSGGTATADFTIAKVNITPTVSIDGWTYNQTAKTPSVSGNSGNGAVTYTYATKGSDNFSATVPTNAGNYTVKATIAATANYNGGTATADFTIAKANITPTVTLEGWTYGQEANAPSISGNTGNGAVTYTYATKGSDNFSATVPTNAGDYIVKATIAESGKYNGGEATKNFTIAKKAATITVEAKSKTYSDVDPTLTATVDGTVGGDTLNYTLSRTEGNNFGEYDITVNLGENPNYEITAIGAKLTINKKAVTITAKNQSIYVGGTVPALEGVDFYTVTGLVGEDTLTTQPTLAYQKDGNAASPVNTTAGTYDIVPSGADAGGNYEITYENGILTISRRSSSGGGVSTYAITPVKADNGSVSVSRTTAVKGNTVTITVKPDKGYKVGNVTVIDALGKAVKVTQNDDGTYTFTQPSSKVTITPVFVKEGGEPTTPLADPTTPPADNDNPFADVKNGDYFYNPVLWAAKENITSGTTDTTFSPNESCTRGQTVTFLWRAAGSPEPTTTVNPFTDVKENDYFYKAVLWAYENGITQGTSVSEFSPSATVTRGQTVTFLYRSAGENTNGENPFTDVRAGDYYYDSVLWAYGNDITSGTSIATFSPNEDCLRGQIVTFLYRCKK